MHSDQKNSCFSSLIIMILREIRIYRGIHQGVWAEKLGKTPSTINKIENGSIPLTVEAFLAGCLSLNTPPSRILFLMEWSVSMLNSHGFYFQVSLPIEEDDLLNMTKSYWKSPGLELLKSEGRYFPVENIGNPFSPQNIPTIIEYIQNPSFKKDLDAGKVPPFGYAKRIY